MAEITDKTIALFLNDQVRPMAEAARSFKLRLKSLVLDYETKIENEMVKMADEDIINDGREVEGVPLRTIGEFREWLAILRKVVDSGVDQWPEDLIAKFCVRKLDAN